MKKIGLISASIALGTLFMLNTHSEEVHADNTVGTSSVKQNLDFATVSYYFDGVSATYSGQAENIILTTDDEQQVTFSFDVNGKNLEFKGNLYYSSKNSNIYLLETMNGESSAIEMTLSVQKIDDHRSSIKLRSGSTNLERFFDAPHIRPNLDTLLVK